MVDITFVHHLRMMRKIQVPMEAFVFLSKLLLSVILAVKH